MKRAKVTISLVLALTLFFAFNNISAKSAKQPVAPVLDRILKKGELVVGTAGSMPPLNMTTKTGEIIGLEAELAGAIAASMGVKLRMEAMPFSELLGALEAGKIDMILSGMTMTPGRNLKVAFVGPYYISGKAFLTKNKEIASAQHTSDIDSPDNTLVALKGSTSQNFVEGVLPKAKLVTAKDYDEAVKMVLEGKATAMVADYPICVVSVFRYPDKGLASVITPFTYEPIGIALPPNDPLLVNWMQNFLNTLEESGELEKLKDHWLKPGPWVKKLK
jgi:polar amino acid transport system substrate-binding protein